MQQGYNGLDLRDQLLQEAWGPNFYVNGGGGAGNRNAIPGSVSLLKTNKNGEKGYWVHRVYLGNANLSEPVSYGSWDAENKRYNLADVHIQPIYEWRAIDDDGSNFDATNHFINWGGGVLGALEGFSSSNGYWLGNNGLYNSNSWGGNRYTGSRSGAFRTARNYKIAGKVFTIVEAGIGVYSTIEGYEKDGGKFGYHAQHAAVSSAAGIGLGIAGAKAGASIGAAVGVWFGGVGAVPGAVIGGVVGGFVMGVGGSYLGGYLGGLGVDYIHGK